MARVISLDPSGGKGYAGLIVADVDIKDTTRFYCELLEIQQWPFMQPRELLAGLRRLFEIYRPSFLIVEEVQSFALLKADPELDTLMKQHRVRYLGHFTGINKIDPERGVMALGVDFELGRIRLPYGDVESRSQSLKLKKEATTFPQGKTTDLVMATWFLKHNHKKMTRQLVVVASPGVNRWNGPVPRTKWDDPPPRRGFRSSGW